LLFPEFAMTHFCGFAIDPSHSHNGVLGEVRATYGGLFAVIGVYTLLAVTDPAAYRSRLLFVGSMWLGACGGPLTPLYLAAAPGRRGGSVPASAPCGGGALRSASARAPAVPATTSLPSAPPAAAQ